MIPDTPLLHAFHTMEEEREQLLGTLMDHDVLSLEQHPAPGAWSVAQAVTHLAIAEENALAYMDKKMHYGKHRKVNVVGPFRLLTLRVAFMLPVRWKAPALVADIPATDWPKALARWIAIREDMEKAYKALPSGSEKHDLHKHPSVGRMDLLQGIRFMRVHVQHHRRQIMRTLNVLSRESTS